MKTETFGRKSLFFVALAILQITKHTSAQNTTESSSSTTVSPPPPSTTPAPPQGYLAVPFNLTVELGDQAQFFCGVPKSAEELTFTFYGHAQNYSLSCPSGHIEDIPQAIEGLCIVRLDELTAVWILKGSSIPDDGSRVVCQRSGHAAAPTAYLRVHKNGSGTGLLIGLVVGGFFGIIIVFALFYLMLTKSERLQICFIGKNNQAEDLTEIVDNIEATATSQPTLNEKMRDL